MASEEALAAPSALPTSNVAAGQSRMVETGAMIAAKHLICIENQADYPALLVKLDARVMMRMYRRIIFKLCTAFHRELGYNSLAGADLEGLQRLGNSIAYVALRATYAVLYEKRQKIGFGLVRGQILPITGFPPFPSWVTTLINSIGPIRVDAIPTRRIYVPHLAYEDVGPLLPTDYDANALPLFNEKVRQTNFPVSSVITESEHSSGWWTYWVTTSGRAVEDMSMPGETLSDITLWSPLKKDSVEPHLLCAMAYAGAPLARPGLAPFSITEWYTKEELCPFAGNLPPMEDFPETGEYPFYNKTPPAFIEETQCGNDEGEDAETEKRGVATSSRDSGAAVEPRGTKRRRVTVTDSPAHISGTPADGSGAVVRNAEARRYRILYHYFDHQASVAIRPEEYLEWAISFNS